MKHDSPDLRFGSLPEVVTDSQPISLMDRRTPFRFTAAQGDSMTPADLSGSWGPNLLLHGGKNQFFQERPAVHRVVSEIDFKDFHSDPVDGREARKNWPLPRKMIVPAILTGDKGSR
jgi:hypothetical protein